MVWFRLTATKEGPRVVISNVKSLEDAIQKGNSDKVDVYKG